MNMINANNNRNTISVNLTADESREMVLKKYSKVNIYSYNTRKQRTYKNKH